MERYIAVDNVCAWPNLTLLADGTIAAIIFNQPNHGITEGEVTCWVSCDGGYIWEEKGVPVPHKKNENTMNVAVGLTGNNKLTVLCSGWNQLPRSPEHSKVIELTVSHSTDNGETWTQQGSVEKPNGVDFVIPFGDIIKSDDGMLATGIYSMKRGSGGKPHFNSYFIRSFDGGETWIEPTLMAPNANETAILSLGGKRVLIAARTVSNGKEHIEVYSSNDFGETWICKGPATLSGQIPGHLLRLKNGDILLTYGLRNKGYYGIGARVSKDEGVTWSEPVFLIDFEIASDGGYPSSVQLEDGKIVTAYYSNKNPFHNRYHMGVIRWGLEEFNL